MASLPPPQLFHLFGFVLSGDFASFTFYTNKNRKLVFFIKAPPLEPPSTRQIKQRNRWRNGAIGWKALTTTSRQNWNDAARKAYTQLTGYNLFMHWTTKGDRQAIATVERQGGINLLP